ncbi:MAG: lpxA 2, partial [Phycisphaerales bacterium]|nr:lpxA 2 [Phycisphaerales bacterium]
MPAAAAVPGGDATETRMDQKNGKTSEATTAPAAAAAPSLNRATSDGKGKSADARRPAWFRNLFSFRFFGGEDEKISDRAMVHPSAEIAEGVEIGPFCVIGPDVKIAAGCILHNNVTVSGHTSIGRDNIFFPNSVIGTAPQDKKYTGAVTRLEIGSGNAFREACTVHVGTEKGGGLTKIGDDNLFMVNSHIGHDAIIGSHCVVANNVMIAGHVIVGDYVVMNGAVGLNQFVSVGDFAYMSAYARVHHDVPPFCKVDGSDEIRALNKVGMERAKMTAADIAAVDAAFRRLFVKKRPLLTAMREFDGVDGLNPHVAEMLAFLRRRNEGKHGRYLEAQRNKPAEVPPAAVPVAADANGAPAGSPAAPVVVPAVADVTPAV